MTVQALDEERDKAIADAWFADAAKATPETLPAFFGRVMGYEHDYGTVCKAIAACAVATAWAMDRHPGARGGITGFQSGAVMWEFIQHWAIDGKGPMRLIKFSTMLYPQYADRFAQTITSGTWDWLQKEAARLIDETPEAADEVIAHWRSIIAGHVPFGYSVEPAS